MSESIGTGDLCARTGVSFRQVDHWTRCGYLRPAVVGQSSGSPWHPRGSGSRRRFSEGDVRVAAALGSLAGAFDFGRLAEVVRSEASLRWVRLTRDGGVGVEAPIDDGGLYLSVAAAGVAPPVAVVASAGSGALTPPAADAASPGGPAAPGAPSGRGERLDGDLPPANGGTSR